MGMSFQLVGFTWGCAWYGACRQYKGWFLWNFLPAKESALISLSTFHIFFACCFVIHTNKDKHNPAMGKKICLKVFEHFHIQCDPTLPDYYFLYWIFAWILFIKSSTSALTILGKSMWRHLRHFELLQKMDQDSSLIFFRTSTCSLHQCYQAGKKILDKPLRGQDQPSLSFLLVCLHF